MKSKIKRTTKTKLNPCANFVCTKQELGVMHQIRHLRQLFPNFGVGIRCNRSLMFIEGLETKYTAEDFDDDEGEGDFGGFDDNHDDHIFGDYLNNKDKDRLKRPGYFG